MEAQTLSLYDMKDRALQILSDMIKFNTITPLDNGIMDYLDSAFKSLGFDSKVREYGKDDYKVKNLYAKYVKDDDNLCFAGHVDVVPPGDLANWNSDPFVPTIKNDILYGRGCSDMKSTIACFIAASEKAIKDGFVKKGISFLITGDEEIGTTYGTESILQEIISSGEKISACIVGEPTSINKIGDEIKVGRRGSVNFVLTIKGLGGHVGYADNIKNPITLLSKIIIELKNISFGHEIEFFEESNLEFVDVESDNKTKTTNLVPYSVNAMFNVRYVPDFLDDVIDKVNNVISKFNSDDYTVALDYKLGASGYRANEANISEMVSLGIKNIMGIKPKINCNGGATDGRFISKYCSNIVELGAKEGTMHKANENISLDDINQLCNIYYEVLKIYNQ